VHGALCVHSIYRDNQTSLWTAVGFIGTRCFRVTFGERNTSIAVGPLAQNNNCVQRRFCFFARPRSFAFGFKEVKPCSHHSFFDRPQIGQGPSTLQPSTNHRTSPTTGCALLSRGIPSHSPSRSSHEPLQLLDVEHAAVLSDP
jgi:hypothetical protein